MDSILTDITEAPLKEAAIQKFLSTRSTGAVVLFSGNVRNHHEGKSVERIDYSAVVPLAENLIRAIAEEVFSQYDVERVAAVHRLGMVEVEEASVLVGASAAHRDDAFRAARALIDRIKEVLPVWKREYFEGGESAYSPGFSVREEGLPQVGGEA